MNTCLDQDQIVALEEGLGPDPREAIRHLASCDVCKQSLDDAAELRSLLDHAAEVDPPFVEQVVKRIRAESQLSGMRHRRVIGVLEIGLGTSVAAVLLVLVRGGVPTWTDVGSAPITLAAVLVSIAWAVTAFIQERPVHGGLLR